MQSWNSDVTPRLNSCLYNPKGLFIGDINRRRNFLALLTKSDKANLTKNERNELAGLVELLITHGKGNRDEFLNCHYDLMSTGKFGTRLFNPRD